MVAMIIKELEALGFNLEVDGGKLIICGPRAVAPQARPHLEVVRANKTEAVRVLLGRCPKCGGTVFWSCLAGEKHCLNCDPPDWQMVDRMCERGVKLSAPLPSGTPRRRCGECSHFKPGEINPCQSFGRCRLHDRGAYPLRPACKQYQSKKALIE